MATPQKAGPVFTSDPTIAPKVRKYDILRTPPKGLRNIVLLSHYFAWTPLHYWRRRSTPCLGDGCEACKHGEAPRPKGYAAVTAKNETKIWLLEVTENCQEPIKAQQDVRTTLRGLIVALERQEQRANGKLTIHFAKGEIDSTLIPQAPDVEEVLRRIWGFSRQGAMKVSDAEAIEAYTIRCRVKSVATATNGQA